MTRLSPALRKALWSRRYRPLFLREGSYSESGRFFATDGRLLNRDERLQRSLPLLPHPCASARRPEESEHAEALAALADGQLQHLVQLLVGVVRGEAQLVETGQEEKKRRPTFRFESLRCVVFYRTLVSICLLSLLCIHLYSCEALWKLVLVVVKR